VKDLGLIGSFCPRRNFGQGRPPDCLYLSKLGLSECARVKCVRPSDLPWIHDESYRDSQNLAHRLGVNAFFCALIEASRVHESHCLVTWRSEHWVRTRAADVKPDGFGRHLHPPRSLRVLPGVRPRDRSIRGPLREARGYLRLAAGWSKEDDLAGFPNLLLMGQEGVREGEVGKALRHAIQRLHIRAPLATSFPLYVASEDRLSEWGVLGSVWRHAPTHSDRLSLVDLPAQTAGLYRTTPCLGRYFTDADADRWRRIAPASAPPRFSLQPPRLPP